MQGLKIGADNVIGYYGLKVDGQYKADATVTAQLRDGLLAPVGSAVVLNYVSGSNGDYEGTLDAAITAGFAAATYYVDITVVQNGVNNDFRRVKVQARYRDERCCP